MHVKENRMLKKMRAGEAVVSVKTNLADPRVVELAGLCGFECIWLDMEHVPNDWFVIENQIRAARMVGMDTIVRVARGSYSDLIRPFEANADAIMVPHVMSLEDARQVSRQTRFNPIGRRPVDGGNSDGAYCMIDFKQYLAESNREKLVIIQIEDPEPLEELEAIAGVEGIDLLFFGPGDFSHAIGAPGQGDHPMIKQTRRRIVEVARANGKLAGTVGTLADYQELVEMGFQLINIGADVLGLVDYFRNITASLPRRSESK
ncbi:MAG: 5-keto-4-deoxy-D-glucarate aldolase [bacterium ADurb.Bin478]|nr:MAG: 5-keto-4-deoxy-D-glucarate aldolase [bacterium ADurb.Bin478]